MKILISMKMEGGSSPTRWKTLWKKEKLLIMRFALQTHKNMGLFGKDLIKVSLERL